MPSIFPMQPTVHFSASISLSVHVGQNVASAAAVFLLEVENVKEKDEQRARLGNPILKSRDI